MKFSKYLEIFFKINPYRLQPRVTVIQIYFGYHFMIVHLKT